MKVTFEYFAAVDPPIRSWDPPICAMIPLPYLLRMWVAIGQFKCKGQGLKPPSRRFLDT